MTWIVLDSGVARAAEHMEKDRFLLQNIETQENPILHFYSWRFDSATYGHFIDPYELLDREKVEQGGLDLARRPTGGGIIFHLWDFAFSVLVPSHHSAFSQNTLENYAFINRAILHAAEEFLHQSSLELTLEDVETEEKCRYFCMAKPTKYDVMFQGKKIAGAAQRKTKHGYLHQGSICMALPSKEYLQEILLPHAKVIDSMFAFSYPLLGKSSSKQDLIEGRKTLKELVRKHITRES